MHWEVYTARELQIKCPTLTGARLHFLSTAHRQWASHCTIQIAQPSWRKNTKPVSLGANHVTHSCFCDDHFGNNSLGSNFVNPDVALTPHPCKHKKKLNDKLYVCVFTETFSTLKKLRAPQNASATIITPCCTGFHWSLTNFPAEEKKNTRPKFYSSVQTGDKWDEHFLIHGTLRRLTISGAGKPRSRNSGVKNHFLHRLESIHISGKREATAKTAGN